MAALMNDFKVREVCRVAPPPTTSESAPQTSFPLTLWDVQWLRFPPSQRVLFYEATSPFTDSILPKLKHSLSLTLRHFLPLAGTLIWPPESEEPYIRTGEETAGVLLTVAESGADFHALSSDSFRDSALFRPLVPDLVVTAEEAAVIALQVTSFPSRGFCIGITSHHAVLDGRTVTMFTKSWAHLCRMGGEDGSLPPELAPLLDRTVVSDPNDEKRVHLQRWLDDNGPQNRSLLLYELLSPAGTYRGTFRLTLADVAALRGLVHATWEVSENGGGRKPPCRASTYVLACAYVWVCLMKAEGMDKERKVYFAFSADCRSRLDPPLPLTYFGNCLTSVVSDAAVGDLVVQDGVATAAAAISMPIRRLREKGTARVVDEWSNAWSALKTERVVSVAGSPQFEVYATEFGWGRVAKTEVVSTEKTGAIGISESRDGGGGVEVELVLSEQLMEAFASIFVRDLEAMKSPN